MLFLHRKHDYCRCSAVRPHVFLSHSWHFPTLRLPNLAILATSPHVMHRASQHGHLEISGAVPSACWCLSKACFNSWMRWAERFNKVWPWTMELSALVTTSDWFQAYLFGLAESVLEAAVLVAPTRCYVPWLSKGSHPPRWRSNPAGHHHRGPLLNFPWPRVSDPTHCSNSRTPATAFWQSNAWRWQKSKWCKCEDSS